MTIPVCFAASLAIEILQLVIGRGICDVDDLFCNGLGAAMGYFVIMAILSLSNENEKRIKPTAIYACLTLAPVLAIGSIFAAYQMQEYGNLPEAAAYSVDLSYLEWKLDCELADTSKNVPVYRTQTLSKADCDAFATEIAALIGAEVDMVSYYQEMAYYNLYGGIVEVYYHDGSYEFILHNLSFDIASQPNREDIEASLASLGVYIPQAAVFTDAGDGWYSFACDQHVDGDVMMDGVLRVHYENSEDDTRLVVENHLVRYNRYLEEEIISPKEALQVLKNGSFADGDFLKHYASDSVTVISCTLDYEIDTKGFYQPVYIFEILIPDMGTLYTMVPAMK